MREHECELRGVALEPPDEPSCLNGGLSTSPLQVHVPFRIAESSESRFPEDCADVSRTNTLGDHFMLYRYSLLPPA